MPREHDELDHVLTGGEVVTGAVGVAVVVGVVGVVAGAEVTGGGGGLTTRFRGRGGRRGVPTSGSRGARTRLRLARVLTSAAGVARAAVAFVPWPRAKANVTPKIPIGSRTSASPESRRRLTGTGWAANAPE